VRHKVGVLAGPVGRPPNERLSSPAPRTVEINGTEPWPEFSYENLMRCFGEVLTVNLLESPM
jgi:hypothetical protein